MTLRRIEQLHSKTFAGGSPMSVQPLTITEVIVVGISVIEL